MALKLGKHSKPQPKLTSQYRIEKHSGYWEVWDGITFICSLYVNKQGNKWAATHNMTPGPERFIHDSSQAAVDWYVSLTPV